MCKSSRQAAIKDSRLPERLLRKNRIEIESGSVKTLDRRRPCIEVARPMQQEGGDDESEATPSRRSRGDDDHLTCLLCLRIPTEAVVQCHRGHIFCSGCLETAERSSTPRRECPECRLRLPDEPIRNRVAERAIASLPAQCQTCLERMPRGDMHRHVCRQRAAMCSRAATGCEWVGAQRDVEEHERTCAYVACARVLARRHVPERLLRLEHENHSLRQRLAVLEGQAEAEAEAEPQQAEEEESVSSMCGALAASYLRVEPYVHHCHRIALLCRLSAAHRWEAVQAGALGCVVAGMRALPPGSAAQAEGCHLIGNLTSGTDATSAACRQEAMRSGALGAIVAAMHSSAQQRRAKSAEKAEMAESVHVRGCLALSNICFGEDPASTSRRRDAVEAGALQAVVGGMSTDGDAEGNTRVNAGCFALCNVCYGDDPASGARRQTAVDAGALHAIVGGLRAYPASPKLFMECCRALRNLASGSCPTAAARRQAAVDGGALQVVVDGLHAHAIAGRVHTEGCLTLKSLTRGHAAHRDAAMQAGAPAAWLQ